MLENDDMKKALVKVESLLRNTIGKFYFGFAWLLLSNLLICKTDEKDSLNDLYNDFRGHYDQIKSQLAQYQKRLGEEIQ